MPGEFHLKLRSNVQTGENVTKYQFYVVLPLISESECKKRQVIYPLTIR